MKTKTKKGFNVREAVTAVAVALMMAVNCTNTINASATKVFSARSNGFVTGAKINFTNNRTSPGSVYVTFSGQSGSTFITTYLRFYGNRDQILWTGPYTGVHRNMEMYCGTDVYRISAKTDYGTEPITINDGKNCRAR
jgi:hypothetical protein